ncbi:MAG: hypothetical protein IKD75_07700 [Prevotella sp.]|nr:hypothetical protein [Prevotella sp.]
MDKVEVNKQIKLSEHLALPSEATLSQTSELDGVRLSPHFTLGELTVTNVKTADGNIPSHVAIENLKRLCEWLEHLRAQYNLLYGDGSHPIIINSGYRSEAVNKKVGGAPNSNHLSGCAADIHVYGVEEAMRYAVILMNYADLVDEDFDELLIERSKKGTYWVHFAVRPKDNRRKVQFIQT